MGAKLLAAKEDAELVPVAVTLETGPGTSLDVDYSTNDDARPRACLSRAFWCPGPGCTATTHVVWLARFQPRWRGATGGEAVRSSGVPRPAVSKCHRVRGEGGSIGPDLSNLVDRDYDSVLRDLTHPSAAINPDYVTYSIALTDGRVLSGSVRTEGKSLRVGNAQGEEAVIPRADVEAMKPQGISIMPEGLPAILGPERMKNLLTFLLTPPLAPAPIHRDDAPPPRSLAEVEKVLRAGADPADPGEACPAAPHRPGRGREGPRDR